MSESSGAVTSGAVILEECPEGSGERQQAQAQEPGPLRCGGCTLWPRQQTWLCVVPLLIGFIGLGLSLMLLKWIVVGSVRDYVPTDLVDAKGIGQDPLFFSKPSALPKNSDTTATTTTVAIPTSTTVTAVRGRTQTGVAHHPGGTTTATGRGGGASGSQVTPRSTTQRSGNSGGGAPRGPLGTTTTAAPVATSTFTASTLSSPSASNPAVLHDSTQMWTHEHTTGRPATAATRHHVNRKTPASPTIPPLRSEHFKQCHEKDLAYCLNDGECFVIETLSGPHKHCRCREGYQGIRCDQFLPKTDSILSDPNHLGIEFMESKEVYKRQVLSITCIAVGISILGTLCMALYCRNKRRREKLQAHLKESRSLKNYSANASALVSKSSRKPNTSLQLQNIFKRSSQPIEGAVSESSFAQCNETPTNNSRGPEKHYRCSSLAHCSDQRSRANHWAVPRRTPPIPRGMINPIGGSKYSGPSYQHLQELESSQKEVEGCQTVGVRSDRRQDSFQNMQPPLLLEQSWERRLEETCSPLEPNRDHDNSTSTMSLRPPSRPSCSSPPPFRTCSIPIIPSVQGHHEEASCLQKTAGPSTCSTTNSRQLEEKHSFVTLHHTSTPCSSSVRDQQQDEVALLLVKAQEHLRALAHRKQEDSGGFAPPPPRDTVCFLTLNGGAAGGLSANGPTETQLLSLREPNRDSAQPCQ
ncbi:pro-neuregulin-3, membrane-bound isoform isoform X3 [Esox lucius]|uniref:pro-neuregulin-3, membrane-bound isoform isoform X3 n=1 Tax=Esox lucius TaxID=8010 RepID=UPI0014775558|nr:pro-neuregulin-3, membrane-bound isoform isoform X3 [Esox lucius]